MGCDVRVGHAHSLPDVCISRLVLSYVKEGAGQPDFCDGHSPAVTITFVCPSERREVSGLT